jgi:glycosyltransferase involved in cell wall biosynthesis
MKPRKIAIVAEWLTSRGGAESVVFELIKIFPQADIFTTVFNPHLFPELKGKKVTTSFLQKIPILNKKHQLASFLLPRAIKSLPLSEYDLVISSSSAFGKGIRKGKNTFHICYCHTPMRWVWEPNRDRRLSSIPFNGLIRKALKRWDLKSNEGVDLFLANSKNTASKIRKFYKQEAQILYPPVDIEFSLKENTYQKKDYYFAISRFVSYKRIDLAIKACEKLNKKLFIAGTGPEEKKLRAVSGKHTTFLGQIDLAQKIKHYKEARATIFCANEDFGIVPVESLSCGTPVIAYGKGGALEVVEEGRTGVFFEKQNVESLISGILKLEKIDFNKNYLEQSVRKFDRIHFEKNLKKIIDNIRR